MIYLFMEESGDLGFSKGSSKWFVFTLVITPHVRILEHITKKVWRTVGKKKKRLSELHAFHETETTRRKMFRMIQRLDRKDLQICCLIIPKNKSFENFQEKTGELYPHLANVLLKLYNEASQDAIHVCIDRRDTSQKLKKNLIAKLEKTLAGRHKKFIVELFASYEHKALQVADFVSWAIFRKYERGDSLFYDMIKDRIIEECVFRLK